jgi:hypothetical protein
MAKEIKFNIKLLIDGKEQLVTASTSAKELRDNLDAAKSSAAKFREKMITVNQTVAALQNASSAINGLRDTMAGLTASYNAVQQANTQLTTVMRQRMAATEEDIKKVNEVIGAQSKLGVIGGTIQKTGAQQIATFLKEKGTLEQLIPAMNDLLAQQKGLNATQEDARSVANLMGKAMTGQTSALRRVGITFSEAQENIMKYGTEQQRAAMLAQIITDNVGHMNAQLGKTDAGQLKQAEMQFAAIKVQIGELVSKWLPKITFAAQALTIVNSMISLGNSIKGATMVIANFGITTKAVNAVCIGFRASVVGLTAVTRVMQAAFTGATTGATTLKVAIKSLLISTGVGVAVWALTEAISYLATSSDKAAGSTKQLTAEEEAAQAARQQEAQQRAEISAAIEINIAKLKAFKGSKEEEKKLVGEMNNTYGDAMGYYSTVAQWYTALVGNSKAYCNQMINEIRIRNLANKAADLQQKRHDFTHDNNGKTRRFSKKRKTRQVAIGQVDAGDGKIIPQYADVEVKGSSDYEKAKAKVTDLYRKEQVVRKQMESLVRENTKITYKQYDGYSKTAPTTPTKTTTPKTTTPKTTDKKEEPKTHVEELQAQLAAAQKEMDNALTIEARVEADAKVKKIQAQIDEATKGKVTIEAATEPTYIVAGSAADKRKSYSNAQQRIGNIRQDYDSGLIDKASAQKAIADINDQLSALELKPIEVHFKTPIEELQEQLQNARRSLDEATTIEARTKASAKITEIQAEIDEATKGKVSIAAEVTPEYIEQGSAADKRQSYSNAQQKTSRIQNDYEIGIIGKDEAMKQLEDLDAELTQLGLKPLKIGIKTSDIDDAKKKMEGACSAASAMGSSLSSLGNAIGVPELNVAGVLAQSIAVMTEGFATATAQAATLGPWAWIGFAATGIAQLAAMISAMKNLNGFASGGVVGGGSTFGDRKFARVNSGEMILTKWQQARLFQMINTPRYTPPIFTQRTLPDIQTAQTSRQSIDGIRLEIGIKGKTRGTELEQTISNVRRIAAKSGRRSNLS